VAQRSPQHLALGVAIRDQRLARNLSQEALASESGLHRTYVGGIERGERNPSFTNLLRIAMALELPLSQLVAAAETEDGA
jgi:transcriptional regulator with XRE-family HTH domain